MTMTMTMTMTMNPTPPDQPMDKEEVKKFIYKLVMKTPTAMDIDDDEVKDTVHKTLVKELKKLFDQSSAGGVFINPRSTPATSDVVDDTNSTEGCKSEKLSICNNATTEDINCILLDALESILNDLKIKIKRPSAPAAAGRREIKQSWSLFKIFKVLKIKIAGKDVKRSDDTTGHKEIITLQAVDINNNEIKSDKEKNLLFVGLIEQLDHYSIMLKKPKLY